MAGPVRIKKAQAADPGFSLVLDMQGLSPNTMRVDFVLYSLGNSGTTYNSSVQINNKIVDPEVTIAVPFGDGNYQGGQHMCFSARVYLDGSQTPTSLQGTVMAESGEFVVEESAITELQDFSNLAMNNTIQSADGTKVGVMQYDGNFVVYEQSGNYNTQLGVCDSSNSYTTPGATYEFQVREGRLFVRDVTHNVDVSASDRNNASLGASMAINSDGKICMRVGADLRPTPMSPQYLP